MSFNRSYAISHVDDERARAEKPLGDVPYWVTMELIQSMDGDNGWEAVASECDFSYEETNRLRTISRYSETTPARALVNSLSSRNYKVHDLHNKLKSAERYKDMEILEKYVREGNQIRETRGFPEMSSLTMLLRQSSGESGSSTMPVHLSNQSPASGASHGASNFNYNKDNYGDTKATMKEAKNYHNKVIPGTEQPKHSPESNFALLPAEIPHAVRRPEYGSGAAGGSKVGPHRPAPTEEQYLFNNNQPLHRSLGSSTPSLPNVNRGHRSFPSSSSTVNKSGAPLSCEYESFSSAKMAYSYDEIQNATANFHPTYVVGEGAFGTVYVGKLRNLDCAVKRLNKQKNKKEDNQMLLDTELQTLSRYQHENIVTLYGYACDGPELCLVYQYFCYGSLEKYLGNKNYVLLWERRLNVLVGTLKGLTFLHTLDPQQPLIHGDIKSANILLDRYLEAKIGDLGQAKYATSSSVTRGQRTHITVEDTHSKLLVTKAYSAPELLTNGVMSVQSDIYATGVVFLEVCSGRKPMSIISNHPKNLSYEFSDIPEMEWVANFKDRSAEPISDELFVEILKLAKKCIHSNSRRRPKTTDLLDKTSALYESYFRSRQLDTTMNSEDTSDFSMLPSTGSSDKDLDISGYSLSPSTVVESPAQGHNLGQRVENLQQSKLQEYKSIHSSMKNITFSPEAASTNYHEETTNSSITNQKRCFSDQPCPESPIKSLPSDQLPEAFLLQLAYDHNPKEKVEHLPAMVAREESQEEEYSCDPQKLQKMTEFDESNSNNFDYIPPCDPKKMAILNDFDKTNNTEDSNDSKGTYTDTDAVASTRDRRESDIDNNSSDLVVESHSTEVGITGGRSVSSINSLIEEYNTLTGACDNDEDDESFLNNFDRNSDEED